MKKQPIPFRLKRKQKETTSLAGLAPSPLLHPLTRHPPLPLPLSPPLVALAWRWCTPLSYAQKSQNCLRRLFPPQPSARGGPRVFPPMGLSYLLPQLPNLGSPGLALREEVVAGLPLPTPAPSALVIICLPDLVLKVGAYRCGCRYGVHM